MYAGWVGPVPDRVDRGRPGRGRLGRVGAAHASDRRPGPAGRRRHLRHQPVDLQARNRAEDRQQHPESSSTRSVSVTETLDAMAMARAGRLHHGDLAPGRARPRIPRSPTSPSGPAAGQLKTGSASRSDRGGQVQPVAEDRRGVGSGSEVRRPGGVSSSSGRNGRDASRPHNSSPAVSPTAMRRDRKNRLSASVIERDRAAGSIREGGVATRACAPAA